MGWSADYVNPMSFLPLLYTDDVIQQRHSTATPDYDAVVDQIKVEKDPAQSSQSWLSRQTRLPPTSIRYFRCTTSRTTTC